MEEDLKDFAKKAIEFKTHCLSMIKSIHNDSISILSQNENIPATIYASFIDKEDIHEIDQHKMNGINEERGNVKLITTELGKLCKITEKLRLKLSIICQLDDPFFEVLKFLSRKQIFHTIQLTNHRLNKIISRTEEQWPRFKFGRLIIFTDEDLKRTTKYWMFKNRKELKAPPIELAPILGALETSQLLKLDSEKKTTTPLQMMCHYSESTENIQPKSVYFFINVDEADVDDVNQDEEHFEMLGTMAVRKISRYFIQLPAKLDTPKAFAAAIYWFREFSKIHFISVHFEQYRWTDEFYNFNNNFGISKFLPISGDSFKSYNPVSINFLRSAIQMYSSTTLWEIHGNIEFLRYLVGNQQELVTEEKRIPELIRVWGFLPQQIFDPSFGGEISFFDALIQYAKNGKNPCQMIRRIDLNFKGDPAEWIKILPGMTLIYKCQTFKVDEEDGTENETIEIRYRIRNGNERKFEIRVECEPSMLDQRMHAFALILEDEEGKD